MVVYEGRKGKKEIEKKRRKEKEEGGFLKCFEEYETIGG